MPGPVDPTLIDPVTINILIVADRRLRFDKHNYSLSTMIQALNETAGPLVRFSTTTAYRRSKHPDADVENPGAEIPDIVFKSEGIKQFDEIWLMGDHPPKLESTTTELTPEEVAVLSLFMGSETRGGILATGDHLDLGAPLNAQLPRVRTMRMWSGINLPTAVGDKANNTVKPGAGETSEFDNTPQQMTPRPYTAQGSTPYPHPVLSAPGGAIDVLPDHFHEGVCPELTRAMLSDEEFPNSNVLPLIIADSSSHLHGSSRPFGTIAAYDGHLANIGRVVVTSTFHHFTNGHLQGFITRPPAHLASSGGLSTYELIKTYFRNLAIWLAPPDKQADNFARALWQVRWRSSVYAPLLIGTEAIDARRIDPDGDCGNAVILCLGRQAQAALEQLVSPSLILLWSLEMYKQLAPNNSPFSFSDLYPWVQGNERSSAGPVDPRLKELIEYLIGGAVFALASRFPNREANAIAEAASQINGIVREGAEAGLTAFRRSLEQ